MIRAVAHAALGKVDYRRQASEEGTHWRSTRVVADVTETFNEANGVGVFDPDPVLSRNGLDALESHGQARPSAASCSIVGSPPWPDPRTG